MPRRPIARTRRLLAAAALGALAVAAPPLSAAAAPRAAAPAAGGVPTGTTLAAAPTGGEIPAPDIYAVAPAGGRLLTIAPDAAPTTLVDGLQYPNYVAVDHAGDAYVVDYGGAKLLQVTPDGDSAPVELDSGLPPTGVAIDSAGNLYVAEWWYAPSRLVKIAPDGAQSVMADGLPFTGGVAVDSAGDVFVLLVNDNEIVKFPASGGGSVLLDTGAVEPVGMAASPSGDLYVADKFQGVVKIAPDGTQTTIYQGRGIDLAVDAAGNVYVSEGRYIRRIPAGGGAATTVASTLDNVWGVDVHTPPTRVVSGQSVTLSATEMAADGSTPTGTVTFTEGSTTLGTAQLDRSGVATLQTADLSIGTHTITASYSGTATLASSTSTDVTVIVAKAATITTLSAEPENSTVHSPVTLHATVDTQAPGTGTPTGTVTFTEGSTTLGTGTLHDGTADLTTSELTVGTHTITAHYGGDPTHTGSTSTEVTVTVAKATTSTTLSAEPENSTVHSPVTLHATVDTQAPGTGTPTGTVTFTEGSTTLGTGTLHDGTADLTTSELTVGTHTITATYSGTATLAGSHSEPVTVRVQAADTRGPAVRLVLSPATATIVAGGHQAYRAEAFDARGHDLGDVTGATTFTIHSHGSCAANVCTETMAGRHTVTGTYRSINGSAVLTVRPGPPDRLQVTTPTEPVDVGDPFPVTVISVDQYGNKTGDVTDQSTLTITPGGSCTPGQCTATESGRHTVTATLAGLSGTATVTAGAAPLAATGSNSAALLALALVLITGGAAVLAATSRRRERRC